MFTAAPVSMSRASAATPAMTDARLALTTPSLPERGLKALRAQDRLEPVEDGVEVGLALALGPGHDHGLGVGGAQERPAAREGDPPAVDVDGGIASVEVLLGPR